MSRAVWLGKPRKNRHMLRTARTVEQVVELRCPLPYSGNTSSNNKPYIHTMYVWMWVCVCVCACVCVCGYACMRVCMYACMHKFMYACMHACMHACIHGWMHGWTGWDGMGWDGMDVHVCVCTHIHVCTYIHTYMRCKESRTIKGSKRRAFRKGSPLHLRPEAVNPKNTPATGMQAHSPLLARLVLAGNTQDFYCRAEGAFTGTS